MGGNASKLNNSITAERKGTNYNAEPRTSTESSNPLQSGASQDRWMCDHCRNQNRATTKTCAACGTTKGKAKAKAKKGPRGSSASLTRANPGSLFALEESGHYQVGYSMVPKARRSEETNDTNVRTSMNAPYSMIPPARESGETIRRAKTLKGKQWEYLALMVSTTRRAKREKLRESRAQTGRAVSDSIDWEEMEEFGDMQGSTVSIYDAEGNQLIEPTLSALLYDEDDDDGGDFETTNVMSGDFAPPADDAVHDHAAYYSVFKKDRQQEKKNSAGATENNTFDPEEYEARRQKILKQLEYLKQAQQSAYQEETRTNRHQYQPVVSRLPPAPAWVPGAQVPFTPLHPVPSPQPNLRGPPLAAFPKTEPDMSHMVNCSYNEIRWVQSPKRRNRF